MEIQGNFVTKNINCQEQEERMKLFNYIIKQINLEEFKRTKYQPQLLEIKKNKMKMSKL